MWWNIRLQGNSSLKGGIWPHRKCKSCASIFLRFTSIFRKLFLLFKENAFFLSILAFFIWYYGFLSFSYCVGVVAAHVQAASFGQKFIWNAQKTSWIVRFRLVFLFILLLLSTSTILHAAWCMVSARQLQDNHSMPVAQLNAFCWAYIDWSHECFAPHQNADFKRFMTVNEIPVPCNPRLPEAFFF